MPDPKSLTSTLDLFLLALIEQDVNSFYDFRQQAGLSLGATSPAVARLLDQGLITDSSSGPRGKVVYRITAAGRKALRSGWSTLAEISEKKAKVETESILRLVAMARGRQRHRAIDLIARLIEDRNSRLKVLSQDRLNNTINTATRYRRMVLDLEQGRLSSDIHGLKRLVSSLKSTKSF